MTLEPGLEGQIRKKRMFQVKRMRDTIGGAQQETDPQSPFPGFCNRWAGEIRMDLGKSVGKGMKLEKLKP